MDNVERKVGEPDLVLGAVFDLSSAREVCGEVLAIGGGHLAEVGPGFEAERGRKRADDLLLAQSHLLWNVWRDFEMDLLKVRSFDLTARGLVLISSRRADEHDVCA
jgi:hypothetical protein